MTNTYSKKHKAKAPSGPAKRHKTRSQPRTPSPDGDGGEQQQQPRSADVTSEIESTAAETSTIRGWAAVNSLRLIPPTLASMMEVAGSPRDSVDDFVGSCLEAGRQDTGLEADEAGPTVPVEPTPGEATSFFISVKIRQCGGKKKGGTSIFNPEYVVVLAGLVLELVREDFRTIRFLVLSYYHEENNRLIELNGDSSSLRATLDIPNSEEYSAHT